MLTAGRIRGRQSDAAKAHHLDSSGGSRAGGRERSRLQPQAFVRSTRARGCGTGPGSRRGRHGDPPRRADLSARGGHGDRLQHSAGAQPDPGPDHQDRVHRRAGRARRRSARADRPAALPGAARPGDRHAWSRSGPARERAGQSRSLYPARRKGLGHAATRRHSDGAGRATAERDQGGRCADRSRQCAARLHQADVTHRRGHRRAPGRYRQHHPSHRPERPGGGHADRADLGDLHFAGDGPAAHSGPDGQGAARGRGL